MVNYLIKTFTFRPILRAIIADHIRLVTLRISLEQKKKSRNVIDGKTRVLPVPEWKAQEQNALKRVKRLANKVKRFSSETAFPPMGFFYIHAGAVHAFGHEQSCKIFFSKENIQKLDVTVMDTEVTQKDDKPTIDIRNIDLDIDFNNVKINTLRQSYSQLSFNKGAGERSTYKVENRPPYWPEDIPFVSHSKRKGDGSGRIITSDMMVKCLDSFKEYCIEGVQAGFIPINVPETYDILKK
ncbi:uncharacterized protein LOC134711669 [Mytilus trossulus]|uniref:uncharacterized protein LOC134711669 n=1 Tax=Mytilus trossulus TaxID=6551 RepID=UPI00300575D3